MPVSKAHRTDSSSTKNHKIHKKWRFSTNIWLVIIALFAGLGYFAGVNHFQIEAAIGPVFGYKSHSASIDLSSLQETYNTLAANYDGKIDVSKLIQGANSGLVSAVGDTYTVYMTPDEAKAYQNDLSGQIGGGIGAEMNLKNNKITIIRPLDNNPAKAAGLMANDIVLDINGQPTAGMSVDTAVGLIRGDAGTTVKLTIQRGDTVKDYTITRAIINNPSVQSSIEGGIGILTISRFDNQTGSLASIAAQSFIKSKVKGVILDLRDNGGGYVDAARDVAGLWLDNKLLVTEKSGSVTTGTVNTGSDAILAGVPTVVLVNGSSASASEIVAGALQDYKVATLVGENTFGKGSVQELVSLSSGAELKVTIAKWYTPKGKNIDQAGISPDFSVTLSQSDLDKGLDPQLDKAKQIINQ